jgi:hypothetical protein
MKYKICGLCKQKTDIYTKSHKNVPFVDNKTYAELCFTCYFVPKLLDQKYNKSGLISEEINLSYSCDNLSTPKELMEEGSSDSLKYAKVCVAAVQDSCKKCKSNKQKLRPKPEWNIC